MSKTKREKESFKKTFNIDKHLNYWLQDFQEHNLKDIRDEARVFIPIVKKLIDDQLSQKKTSSVDDTKLIARAYIAWVENTKDSNQKIAEMLSQLSNPMSLSQSNIDPKCLYMLINELNKNPKLFSKYLSALECKLIVLLNLSYLSKQGGELDIFNLNLNTVVSDKNQLDEKKVSSSEQSKFQTENDFIDSFDSTINVENYRLLFVNLLTELSAELKELTKRKIESYKPSFFSNREDKSQEKLVSLNQLVSKIASLDLNDKQYLINLRIINNEINSHIIKGSFPESFGLLNHIKCAAQEIIATYDSNKDIKKSLTLEDLDKRVYNIIQKFVQSEELFDDYSIRNPENSKYGDLFDIVVGYTNIMYSNFFRHKSFEKNEKIKLLTNLIADDEHDSLFNLKYGIQTYLDKESNKKDAKNENKIKLAKYYLKLVDDAVDEVNNLLREIRQENEEEKKVEPKKTQKNKEISSFEEIVNNLNTMIQSTGQPSLSIDEDEEKLMSAYNKFHKNFDNDFLANQHSRESLNEILKQYLNKIPNTIKIIELIASKINKEDNDMFRRIQEKYQICISQLNLMKESITNSINDLSTLSAAKETKEKSSNQTISLSSPDSQKDVMKNSRIAKFQRK